MKNKLRSEIIKSKQILEEHCQQYPTEDIRIGFFDGHLGFLNHYYNCYTFLQSDLFIDNYAEVFNIQNLSENEDTIRSERTNQLYYLNSQLLINSWSNFELFITLLSYSILDESSKNKLLNIDYEKIKRILYSQNVDIDKLEKNIAKEANTLKKKHLAQCSINRKYTEIFKLIKNEYSSIRNYKKDIQFLEFYGKLRNCIHSNFIYFGKDYSYVYNNITFQFTNNEIMKQSEIRDTLMIDMSIELREIVSVIIKLIKFNNLIRDSSFDY